MTEGAAINNDEVWGVTVLVECSGLTMIGKREMRTLKDLDIERSCGNVSRFKNWKACFQTPDPSLISWRNFKQVHGLNVCFFIRRMRIRMCISAGSELAI